jgi:hypothetical protein
LRLITGSSAPLRVMIDGALSVMIDEVLPWPDKLSAPTVAAKAKRRHLTKKPLSPSEL